MKVSNQGAKKNRFYSLPFGQAEASIYQPRRHFNQPQKLFVLLLFKFLIKHYLPVGQVKNRIHQPDIKIHQPRAIGQYFLCTLQISKATQKLNFLKVLRFSFPVPVQKTSKISSSRFALEKNFKVDLSARLRESHTEASKVNLAPRAFSFPPTPSLRKQTYFRSSLQPKIRQCSQANPSPFLSYWFS